MNTPHETPNGITIRDIDIPISRMVVIILKLMIASIPALILFYILAFIVMIVFVAVFGGGAALLNGLGQP